MLVNALGDSILTHSGEINRQALAALVFDDSPEARTSRKQLEEIVHPLIHAEAVRRLRQFKESDSPPRYVVIDAPLLLEADWAPLCDLILYIDAPLATRQQRAAQRGWTTAQFEAREEAQLSLEEKRQAALATIDNGPNANPKAQILQVLEEFQRK